MKRVYRVQMTAVALLRYGEWCDENGRIYFGGDHAVHHHTVE